MKITVFVELIPIFIFSFLIMSAFANQNILKAAIWLVFTITGLFSITMLSKDSLIEQDNIFSQPPIIFPLFAKFYRICSTSSFFIIYTFVYLLMPMIYANNINYAIVFLFIAFYLSDVLGRKEMKINGIPNYNAIGTINGTICGILYGILCFFIIYKAGDKYLFFSTSTASSSGEYCSKPSKQQFKCNVYKNGQLISTM
jgi:hypothetical protein